MIPVVHAVLRKTPRPQQGSAVLTADRIGDDETVLVQLQLGSDAVPQPFLLLRHERVDELKDFLFSLWRQQARQRWDYQQKRTFTVWRISVTVAGRAWTDVGSVQDQRLVLPASLRVEPMWPNVVPALPRADDEKGDNDGKDDEDVGEDSGDRVRPQRKMQKVEVAVAAPDTRVVCRYGQQCYRKNPLHLVRFRHPHLEQKEGERGSTQHGPYEEEDEKDDRSGVDS
jgi:hypothetical protein